MCCVLTRWRSDTGNNIKLRIHLYMGTVRRQKDVDSTSSSLRSHWLGQVYCMVEWWVILSLGFSWRNDSEMEHVIRRMRINDTITELGKGSCIITRQQTHSLGLWDCPRLGFVNWPNRLWSFTSSWHSVLRSLLPKRTILRFWVIRRIRHHLGPDHGHKSFSSDQVSFNRNSLDRFSSDKWNVRHCLDRWNDRLLGHKHIWADSQTSGYGHLHIDSIFARWKVHIENVLEPNKGAAYADR